MKVIVLMSTYNGEKYLYEQIESILHQEDVDIYLLIRDDGSKDSTIEVINELRQLHPNIGLLSGDNKGFVGSFSELIKYAWKKNPEYEFFAFADQDDVWYPNKLGVACKKLSEYPSDVPNLYCSNSDIIDSKGKNIGKKFRNFIPHYTRGNILMFPTLQGCSMVFNREALELYAKHLPKMAFHDRWMFLICHFLGNVYYEHTPLFGYRVHCSNAIGTVGEYTFSQKAKRLWNMFFASQESRYYNMNKEFYNEFKEQLKDCDKIIIQTYLRYRNSLRAKIQVLFSKDYTPFNPSLKERILYVPHVLLNKL